MKFTVERSLLLKSLTHIQSVVEKRNTIPVLSNVKLEAINSKLVLKATDMEIEIEETIAANVLDSGLTTVSAHTLYDIVRKLPDGCEISFDFIADNSSLVVKAGRSNFSLSCLPAEDFPTIAGEDLGYSFLLDSKDLAALIDKTKFAVSTEETRFYLNGIYLHTTEKEDVKVMRSVATDGHRLACMEIDVPKGAESIPGIIIPRKTITEVKKLIDTFVGEISVSLSENMIKFTFDDVILTSKLIDGNYPDYEKVIPKDNNIIMDADVAIFAGAVDRVSIVSEKTKGVKLLLKNSTLVISSSNQEAGSATEEIDVSYNSEALEIGFNYRYLLDILQEVGQDTVRFAFSDSASPTVINNIADTRATYVLMPMRV
ncbi:MAG: DNA polymerase III subunit beta [Alphaproteobacteria bacterium]